VILSIDLEEKNQPHSPTSARIAVLSRPVVRRETHALLCSLQQLVGSLFDLFIVARAQLRFGRKNGKRPPGAATKHPASFEPARQRHVTSSASLFARENDAF
jgi:hypothetical protein